MVTKLPFIQKCVNKCVYVSVTWSLPGRHVVNLLRWRKRDIPLSCGDVCQLIDSRRFWILSQRQTQQQQEVRPFSQVSGNTGNKQVGCWETASYENSARWGIWRLLIVRGGYFQSSCWRASVYWSGWRRGGVFIQNPLERRFDLD